MKRASLDCRIFCGVELGEVAQQKPVTWGTAAVHVQLGQVGLRLLDKGLDVILILHLADRHSGVMSGDVVLCSDINKPPGGLLGSLNCGGPVYLYMPPPAAPQLLDIFHFSLNTF